MIFSPTSSKLLSGLWIIATWIAVANANVQAQGPTRPNRLSHVVTAEPVLGSIRPRGYLPVRITIQRQGTQAVAQRNTTYHIYQKDQRYQSGGLRTQIDAHRLVLTRGTASASGVFLFRGTDSNGWGSGIYVETDGDLRNSLRSADVAGLQSGPFLFGTAGNTDASSVRCLFVSAGSGDVTHKYMFTSGNSQFMVAVAPTMVVPNVQSNGAEPGESVSEVDQWEIPTAWELRDVLAQDNQQRNDPWSGAQVVEDVFTRPAIADRESNLAALNQFEFMDHVTIGELPETWQGLAPVDYLFISAADLKTLQSGRPAAWQAMREWVAAGGRLVLVKCGSNCESLRDLERDWFELGAGEVRRVWKRTSLEKIIESARKWGTDAPAPDPAPTQDVLREFSNSSQQAFEAFAKMASAQNVDDERLSSNGLLLSHCYLVAQLWNPESEPFDFDRDLLSNETLYSNFGAGRVVATPGSYSTWTAADWKTVLATGLAGAPGPLLRDSFGPETAFVFPPAKVPGIGEPPWFLFIGMITIFAIGIGPVAYSLLASRKRIPWILGLVPIVAGTLTVGLLLFAILSEGLGTRVVRFGVTRIDADSGQAFTKTHLTVYSGTSPGSYVFDDHSMLFPDLASDYESRTVNFSGTQQLSGGGIRARTIHQLVMAEPNRTDARLIVEAAGDDGRSWKITNRTGAGLAPIIAKTDDGWLFAESLSNDQSVTLETVDSNFLVDALIRITATPGSRLNLLDSLNQDLPGNEATSWGRPTYQNPNYNLEERSWHSNNDLWLPGTMTKPEWLRASIPVGGWLGLTSDWEMAGKLPIAASYTHDFQVIHGRWK